MTGDDATIKNYIISLNINRLKGKRHQGKETLIAVTDKVYSRGNKFTA